MSKQQITKYINLAFQFLNDKLDLPATMLQNTLALRIESLPQILTAPFNFTAAMMFLLFIIIGYANNLICSLIGVIYPIFYGLELFNTKLVSTNKLILLNKYWILFGLIHLIDLLFGFILNFIRGYFYLKIALVYVLIRNDFRMSDKLFNMFEKYYVNSNIYPKIEILLSFITKKINTPRINAQPINTQPINTQPINTQPNAVSQGNRSVTQFSHISVETSDSSVSDTSVPKQTSDTSVPKQTSDISVPKQTSDTSIPKETSDTSIPKKTSDTSVPEETFDTSFPKETSDTSVPEETFDINFTNAELSENVDDDPSEELEAIDHGTDKSE